MIEIFDFLVAFLILASFIFSIDIKVHDHYQDKINELKTLIKYKDVNNNLNFHKQIYKKNYFIRRNETFK